MNRIGVKSSNIRSIGYDSSNETLEVEFLGGGIYQYFKVNEHHYKSLMESDSKGRYFIQFIRDQYKHTKVLNEKDRKEGNKKEDTIKE